MEVACVPDFMMSKVAAVHLQANRLCSLGEQSSKHPPLCLSPSSQQLLTEFPPQIFRLVFKPGTSDISSSIQDPPETGGMGVQLRKPVQLQPYQAWCPHQPRGPVLRARRVCCRTTQAFLGPDTQTLGFSIQPGALT